MPYQILTQDEQDDLVVENLLNEERALFRFNLSKVQLEKAIEGAADNEKTAERISLDKVNSEIMAIEKSIVGLQDALPKDSSRIESSKSRVIAKQEANQ